MKTKAEKIFTDIAACPGKPKKAIELLEKHLRDIHEEAVSATVMAMNKKTFVKPEFKPI